MTAESSRYHAFRHGEVVPLLPPRLAAMAPIGTNRATSFIISSGSMQVLSRGHTGNLPRHRRQLFAHPLARPALPGQHLCRVWLVDVLARVQPADAPPIPPPRPDRL